MAIDARIPLGVQAPQPVSPIDSMGRALTLKSMMQRGEAQDLQLEQEKQQMAAQQRAAQGRTALSELLASQSGPDGRVNHRGVEKGLAERGFGDLALEYGTKRRADMKAESDQAKVKLENHKAQMQLIGNAAGGILSLPPEQQPAAYMATRARLIQQGIGDEASIPAEFDPQIVAQFRTQAIDAEKQVDQAQKDLDYQLRLDQFEDTVAREKPATLQKWLTTAGQLIGAAQDDEQLAAAKAALEQQEAPAEVMALFAGLTAAQATEVGMTPDQRTSAAGQAEQRRLTQRGQDMQAETARAGQAITVRGQNMNDTRARELNAITRDQKPPSEGERAAFGYYTRALDAHQALEGMEEKMASKNLAGQAAYSFLPNAMQSEENQLYKQAQRQFTEARLRKDSGAAIAASEYANDEKTYFPQPGDTPAVLQRKRQARSMVLRSLKDQAGRAYREDVPGSGAAAGATPDAAAAAAAPKAPAKFEAIAVSPDGKRIGWNGSAWVEVK